MFSADFSQFLDSLGMFGWRLGLENIRTIMDRLGDPQRQFICVHVAGSNGKGSVSHFLEAVFRAAGYRTGLYTSPHLLTPAERVRIAGQTLSDAEFERRMRPLLPVFEQQQATYFEAMTAFALHCFAGDDVEIAIVETGLGGRLDAT
ncbi:MAG TPA: bifunctional folylpolyglutamate synthase/dihydrofolate synthase, partial [Bacteroidetes bacterium]|nr:bifunctional folylpolyglutamate synthase/dihydrofolate synthase [Bacteroidota bacterium]